MRKKKYTICLGLLIVLGLLISQSCSSKASNAEVEQESCCSSAKTELKEKNACSSQKQEEPTITAYYFHATRRCATCQAVEKVSKEYIVENYAGKVNFISINREEDQNSELVQKYEIAGQTLLIVFGDEVVNLTTEAFLNARTNPEKLQELIKSTIDARLI